MSCESAAGLARYNIHMKRTNLVLDAPLLETATRVLGAKTYSAAVNMALAEVIRVRKIQSLRSFFGQGLWQGDLPHMRGDQPESHRHKVARRGNAKR